MHLEVFPEECYFAGGLVSPMQLGEEIISCQCSSIKKGSEFAFKVAHSWFGDEARPDE